MISIICSMILVLNYAGFSLFKYYCFALPTLLFFMLECWECCPKIDQSRRRQIAIWSFLLFFPLYTFLKRKTRAGFHSLRSFSNALFNLIFVGRRALQTALHKSRHTHRCMRGHNIPQDTHTHTPTRRQLTKAQSKAPKRAQAKRLPSPHYASPAVHATPRGARRFHALRLAKWMLSVMRFLCKFSPKKEPNTHAYKHTHTKQTQMKQWIEEGGRTGNSSAMISLPRSQPDKRSTSPPSCHLVPTHPRDTAASISARGTDRQVAIYQMESRRYGEGITHCTSVYIPHWANEALMGAAAEQTTSRRNLHSQCCID